MKVLAIDIVIIIYNFVNTYAKHVYACVSMLIFFISVWRLTKKVEEQINVTIYSILNINISSKRAASTKVNNMAPTLIDP